MVPWFAIVSLYTRHGVIQNGGQEKGKQTELESLNYICTEKFGTCWTNTQQRIIFHREWTDFRRAYLFLLKLKRPVGQVCQQS